MADHYQLDINYNIIIIDYNICFSSLSSGDSGQLSDGSKSGSGVSGHIGDTAACYSSSPTNINHISSDIR